MTFELPADAPTMRYFSYDAKHGEPRIIAAAATAAATAGLPLQLESHLVWNTYRDALPLGSYSDFLSTHGWSPGPGRFRFSRQRPEEDQTAEWKTPRPACHYGGRSGVRRPCLLRSG